MRPLTIQFPILATLLFLGACKPTTTTYTVVLLDTSKSITAEGFQSEFKAVDNLVDRMQRGDRLTIIPINSHAGADTPGRVLSFSAPTDRQPYNADLTAFQKEAHKQIASLRSRSTAEASNRTDILGALDMVEDELREERETSRDVHLQASLYIFSDFVEDDETHHFTSVKETASKVGPTVLAQQLQKDHHLLLPNSYVVRLVKIQSSDAQKLNAEQDEWIRAFWSAYFLPCNAQWTPLDVSVH